MAPHGAIEALRAASFMCLFCYPARFAIGLENSAVTHRTPIVGGNWKMNTDLASAVELAEGVVAGCAQLVQRCDVVVYPPFPYLQAVGRALGHSGILLGAQDVYYESN